MESIWHAAATPPRYPALEEDIEVDVAIVGGGITGVLCALKLRADGWRVAVLEAQRTGQGSTGNSTGNLYALIGERHGALDRNKAGAVLRARAAAVDDIERIVERHRIDCGFVRCPWVMYAETDAGRKQIDDARELIETYSAPSRDATALLPFAVKWAVGIDGQAQFNPLRFVDGVADAINGPDCRICEHTRVMTIESGERCTLRTDRATIKAGTVVLATHTPKGVLKMQALIAPYREYGVAAPFRGTPLPPGIFWRVDDPFRSVRSYRFEDRDYLIVVGCEHKTGEQSDTDSCYDDLAKFATSTFDVSDVQYRWSAQNYRPADGLPYIGRSAMGDNVLLATGYAADGLTYAHVAATIIADLVANRRNEWLDLFEAGRFTPVASAKNVISENVKVAGEYLRGAPGVEPIASLADIKNGEARIVELAGEKCAAYRDEGGQINLVSAVCTHMRCIVRWNSAEHTWDCPCHGSRFAPDGMVIEGPALADLPARTPTSAESGRGA